MLRPYVPLRKHFIYFYEAHNFLSSLKGQWLAKKETVFALLCLVSTESIEK